MLIVHLLRTDLDADVLQGLTAALLPHERARVLRRRRPDDQRHGIVAYAALRHLLAARLGCAPLEPRFERTRLGKPHLAGAWHDAGVHFNVSHSGAWVAVAVAGHAVGVDVECGCPPDHRDIAARWFRPEEAHRAGTPAGFLSVWTAKEAVLKASGEGLGGDWQAFAVPCASPRLQPVEALDANTDHASYRVASQALDDDCWIAAAVRGQAEMLEPRRLDVRSIAAAGLSSDSCIG
ncbi:4'-phosphopantetheinyl transferase superfamily protein [Verticiella sediminum]|uniref:4'-phosphopantetheinyl transferase superfamily protein n=1 Tax=Verticiella sediminum TaxID=1247510 RepID=A0A556A5U6_9BURK|nr:4'-phosphopantetheinyl transferase superfamily protein [Verticiella sediminum]TSH88263.1 4'-phosphopantetheinyl transferase superfamily protein [Verticiella sediminum]